MAPNRAGSRSPRGGAIREIGTLIRRVPLIASGALRRFAEDPWRGVAAASRAMPALGRVVPDPSAPLARVERAVAEDRWGDAIDARASIEVLEQQKVADAAIARSSGQVSSVAAMRATSRALRRQVRAARRESRVLRSPLPSWAYRQPQSNAPQHPQPLRHEPRILHVVTNALPRVQAGSTIRTHRVAQEQGRLGWQVGVATRPGFPVFHGDLLAQRDSVYDGVRYHALLPTWLPAPERIPIVYANLLDQVVAEGDYRVLHGASDHVNGRAALEVGRRRGLPVAFEVRTFPEDAWLSRHGGEAARKSDTYRWLRERHREILLAADAITTLGTTMKAGICDLGVDPDRVFIVGNAVPEAALLDLTTPAQARSALGIDGGDLTLGTVTTMYGYEGIDLLIDAAAVLRSDGLDARVLLVGDGPERDALIVAARSAGVPCTAPGRIPVDSVTAYIDAIDVFVMPRRTDAITERVTALKPLEAQARGVPVVGSDLPAVAEVLAPDSDLVSGRDPQMWAGVLAGYADESYRAVRGDAAREWVRACRTWPHVMQGYASAYSFLGLDVDGARI